MNKTVSIALAAYNGPEYIASQLQSLLDQSRLPDEIIICDDSADAKTFEALQPFLSLPQIKYQQNSPALGIAKNFEKAISLCCGDYIFLCDQDDVWLPEKVELMAKMLDADPELDGVFCNSDLVDSQLNALNKNLWQLRRFTPAMQKTLARGDALKVFLQRITLSGHNIAFKRRALEYILPFPELKPFYPDSWIALAIAANGKWQALNRSLTFYRVHDCNRSNPSGNALQAAGKARKSAAAKRNYLLAQELLQRSGAIDTDKLKLIQTFSWHHFKRSQYSSKFLLRIVQTLCEACTLRYSKYSNGLRTIIADILFAPAPETKGSVPDKG